MINRLNSIREPKHGFETISDWFLRGTISLAINSWELIFYCLFLLMGTVTLFKSKMSYSRVLLHSECHITTFLEGDPIKNQFKWQIELYLVSVQRRK